MKGGSRVSSGIDGLDTLLNGGFPSNRTYMVRGRSGTGKTIVGYHFLDEGLSNRENVLYITFEEPSVELIENAETLGFDFSEMPILDLSPTGGEFTDEESYSVLMPSEVEGESTKSAITEAVEEHQPNRVVIDPLSQLRHLSPDEYQFNKTAASLMRYLKDTGATTLFTSQPDTEQADEGLQYLCNGSITISRTDEGRFLKIEKLRGSDFQSGTHAFRIDDGKGIHLFPKLRPENQHHESAFETVPTNVGSLDSLLGGGLERGSITLVSGPSGVGKSTTATTLARAFTARNERAALYLFEESEESFKHRSSAVGHPVNEYIESGDMVVEAIEPLTLSADEFADRVRTEVEENDTKFVLIDGTAGYELSLHAEGDDLRKQLHALARYLRNLGVTVVITDEIQDVTGGFRASDSHVSYLADNILFFRYIEVRGDVQKAVGVLKKRFGPFESTLRSFRIDSDGIHIGDPLDDLRGVLTGTPTWDGET
ncbi:AAA family ATPase [Natronomonas gomsonensis]|uniref:ATPase domain-containing protein n=1 Tax=Natronomonas gomsonensis TaxID=1046043 RepID=UPI0020CA3D75|nr:ATPase domain-containing protein [Natronomonas gomsonensis]MCY4731153.1 AAA family ATPase [Natronomonas gomsonensis]